MAKELAEAPAAVRPRRGMLAAPLAVSRRLAAPIAGRCRHLRAGQLCACGDLRQAPDRAISRYSRRGRSTQYRDRLSSARLAPRSVVSRHLAIGRERRPDRSGADGARGGCDHGGLVNAETSPLAAACEIVLPIAAGPELSVAATKTFVASLAAVLRLTANWTDDDAMRRACDRLPKRLAKAARLDWSAALGPLAEAQSLVAIGRGPTLAIAREAALKLKETCALHAEAFSSAEFRHGPIALVSRTYPMLVLAPTDEAGPGIAELVVDLRREGARVLVAGAGEQQPGRLPALAPEQPDADAICLVQSFYAFLVGLAQRRGTNVDHPRHLQKVTRTR